MNPATSSRPKPLLANAFWNCFSTVLPVAAAFLLAPLFIERLGTEQFGLYLLLSSVSGFLGIMNLGLGEATLRYVAYHHGRNDLRGVQGVFQATFLVYTIMALVGSLGLLVGAPSITGLFKLAPSDARLATGCLRLTALAFGLRFITGPFEAISRALERYDIAAHVTLSESALRAVGAAGLVLCGLGLYGLVLWNCVVAVFFLATNILVARRLIPSLRPSARPPLAAFREVFGYGVFAFLGQVSGIIWLHADKVIVGALIGASAVAHLAVPRNLMFRALGVASAGGVVLMPRFSGMEDREDMRRLYITSTSMLLSFTIILFVPAAVLMPDFLRLWISPEFAAESGLVAQLIAASCLVRGAFLPYESLFRGLGKPQYYLVLICLGSATCVIANLILIPAYGLVGAAYSLCISPIWGGVTILVTWRRILKARRLSQLGKFVGVPFLLGLACLAAGLWLRSRFAPRFGWTELVCFGAAIAALTTVTTLGYGLAAGGRNGPAALLALGVKRLLVREQQTGC